MGTILTQEELEILNSILKYINPREKYFCVEEVHAEKILKPLYPRANDGTGLTNYDNAKKNLSTRKVYDNIVEWLIEQSLAVEVKPQNSIWVNLKFTKFGEVLWAYGDIYKYFDSKQPLSQEKILACVPAVMEQAFSYGEFTIEIQYPKQAFVNLTFLSPNDDENRKKIEDAISGKPQLIQAHEQSLLYESALQHLVNEGFAINRHDIKTDGKIYRQLTDKGRELKRIGSLDAYNQSEEMKEAQLAALESDRKRDFQRNEYQFWVNFSIAISTGIAAVFYFFGIFDYYEKHSLKRQYIAYFLTGFGLAVLIWLVQWQLKKIKR